VGRLLLWSIETCLNRNHLATCTEASH